MLDPTPKLHIRSKCLQKYRSTLIRLCEPRLPVNSPIGTPLNIHLVNPLLQAPAQPPFPTPFTCFPPSSPYLPYHQLPHPLPTQHHAHADTRHRLPPPRLSPKASDLPSIVATALPLEFYNRTGDSSFHLEEWLTRGPGGAAKR
jgi:hypothetical protein